MHTLDQLRGGALRGVTRLDLSAGLTELPPEVFDLADTLEVLNLSGNALTHLPDDLPRLHKLRVIFASDNPFTALPAVLGRCASLEVIGFRACRIEQLDQAALPPRLRWLILTDNRLTALPEDLGERRGLHKLMLAGNRLTSLPASLAQCTGLELLRLSANALEVLPKVVTALPALSWLAVAGNPFADRAEQAAQVTTRPAPPLIPAADLRWGDPLGEGASGVLHRADWFDPDGTHRPVAIKRFKGAMTSDGLPRCERAACLAAGEHPTLIGTHGALDDGDSLVLDWIPPSFQTLAGPPSLHSCTRDVYPDERRFSPAQALRLATDVAGACAHLHARGLLHGDLYAHNILWQPDDGAARLGDLGAASFLPADADLAQQLRATDVRALGVLLTELAARVDSTPKLPPAGSPPARSASGVLTELAARCLEPQPLLRPDAADLHRALVQAGAGDP